MVTKREISKLEASLTDDSLQCPPLLLLGSSCPNHATQMPNAFCLLYDIEVTDVER